MNAQRRRSQSPRLRSILKKTQPQRRSATPPARRRSSTPTRPRTPQRQRNPQPRRNRPGRRQAAPVALSLALPVSRPADRLSLQVSDMVSALQSPNTATSLNYITLLDSLLLNPFQFSGTRMAVMQQVFAKFRFSRARLRYDAALPTSTSGGLIIHYQPNPRIEPFQDTQAGLTSLLSSGAVVKSIWQSFEISIPVAANARDNLFAHLRGTDLTQTMQGRIDIYTNGTNAGSALNLGYLTLTAGLDLAEALLGDAIHIPLAPSVPSYNSGFSIVASPSWEPATVPLPALLLDVSAASPALIVGDLIRFTILSSTTALRTAATGGTAGFGNNVVYYVRVNTLDVNGIELVGGSATGCNNYCYRHAEDALALLGNYVAALVDWAPPTALTVAAGFAISSGFRARIEVLTHTSD